MQSLRHREVPYKWRRYGRIARYAKSSCPMENLAKIGDRIPFHFLQWWAGTADGLPDAL